MASAENDAATGLPPGIPARLRNEFEFYDNGAIRHLTRFQRLKVVQLIAGGAIPVAAVIVPPNNEMLIRAITACLGALVAGIESYVQFRQFHQNWIRWRTAAEALRREAFLFSEKAGPYRNVQDPEVLLAENVEDIIAIEQRSWRSLQENPHPSKEAGSTSGKT